MFRIGRNKIITVAYELYWKHGISEGTLRNWKAKVSLAGAPAITGKRMVTDPVEAGNMQLKEALADAMLTIQIQKNSTMSELDFAAVERIRKESSLGINAFLNPIGLSKSS